MNPDRLATTLCTRPLGWLSRLEGRAEIALSSRVRLARNLDDTAFPDRAPADVRGEVFGRVSESFMAASTFAAGAVVEMPMLTALDRQILLERHILSADMNRRGAGSGFAVSDDEGTSVLINEEDHIRLQVLLPGLALPEAWQMADQAVEAAARALPFAFDPVLGYLTACPTNVGTGMRASVMLHLPALMLEGHIKSTVNACHKLGFAVRGALGEGTEALGNLFQVSNQSTLGESETEILTRLERTIRELVWHEENARTRLLSRERARLYDFVGRAYGQARFARLMTSEDALNCLSALRLGVEMGLVRRIGVKQLVEMFRDVQPGHLQGQSGRALDREARDVYRAGILRRRLHPGGRHDRDENP